jgi:hypothetical protein
MIPAIIPVTVYQPIAIRGVPKRRGVSEANPPKSVQVMRDSSSA